jgi:PEP-CTERM motif-containing protein
MLRKFRVLILLALAALAWNVTPAYSTTLTTYTSLASFNAATSGDTTIDFTGLSTAVPGGDYSGSGLTVGNVDFLGFTNGPNWLQVWDTSTLSWANFGTGEALVQQSYPSSAALIRAAFTTPVTAFGTNLFTANTSGLGFVVTVLGTPFTVTTSATAPPTFWGVTSDTPISSVDFTLQPLSSGSQGFLDNFTYGTANAQAPPPPPDVPEAATMLLIGSGLLGLAILGKKMRPAQFV